MIRRTSRSRQPRRFTGHLRFYAVGIGVIDIIKQCARHFVWFLPHSPHAYAIPHAANPGPCSLLLWFPVSIHMAHQIITGFLPLPVVRTFVLPKSRWYFLLALIVIERDSADCHNWNVPSETLLT